MSDVQNAAAFWAVSNVQAVDLLVWLEPWAEEFRVPPRSTVVLDITNSTSHSSSAGIEVTATNVVIWGDSGDLIAVSIDGVLQDSWSAREAFPTIDGVSMKTFLKLAFGSAPPARLGGQRTDLN